MGLHVVDIAIFFAFVVAVISFGLVKSRQDKGDSESYFLAGRGLSWWLIGFSLIAANISAEQFVGMSGQAAKDHVGLAIASYEWFAAVTLVVVAFFFLPKFLRSGIYTIPEYLEYRYDTTARTIMSLMMMATLVCVNITCVIFLGAKALEPLFKGYQLFGQELNITVLSWIVGIAAAIYVAVGGLKACAWTDLFWGSSLIIGGAVIMVLTFMALDKPAEFAQLDTAAVCESIGVEEDASLGEKFSKLKERKMHMVLPADNPELPWTALIIGIWIPNFYYWGLNQYIMQRTLGARSLADGQRGIVFAAGMKLIIPFIVCVPGIIAFSLYHDEIQGNSAAINEKTLEAFTKAKSQPTATRALFPMNGDFVRFYPGEANEVLAFNAVASGILPNADMIEDELREALTVPLSQASDDFKKRVQQIEEANKNLKEGETPKVVGLDALNGAIISVAENAAKDAQEEPWNVKTELVGYDYDSAFPTLVAQLSPVGLRGFVLAALMGAVVSSLAAMLNAASTIFTMDVFQKYIKPDATQGTLVTVGRCCVPLAVLVGCVIAPQLAKPEYRGAFAFIQEFQGYISPGILTVFLFGLFVPRTPRACGMIGLALCPIIYGLLHVFCGEQVAFLNRMAITAGVLTVIMGAMTVLSPLKEPVKLPEQTDFDMTSSGGAKIAAVVVVIATVALYAFFW